MPVVIKNIQKMKQLSLRLKKKNMTIGFVPTMGCLHQGHISLIERAKKDCDAVIVSIFVNPTQFGPKEDLKKYPKDLSKDLALLSKHHIDAVFCPSNNQMYPKGYRTFIEVAGLQDMLCGGSRPGHFRGVATIVSKLFNIVMPDIAYFGKKDYQQQVIIKKMAEDLNMGVKIVSLPTVREKNGLAMSSRNKYLDGASRRNAAVISRALKFGRHLVKVGVRDPRKIKLAVAKMISSNRAFKVQYVSLCDLNTMEEVKKINGRALLATAAVINGTRLIDNVEV